MALVLEPVALGNAAARRRRAVADPDVCRRSELGDLPAVDAPFVAAEPAEGRRRRRVLHPAQDAHRVSVLDGLHPGGLGDLGAPGGRPVNVGEVGEIQKVVDDELDVRVQMELDVADPQSRTVQHAVIGNCGLVRLFGIPHPDPQKAVLLRERVGANADPGRNARLSGNLHASAGTVVPEAVVAALDRVADQAAQRQGNPPMGATVLQSDRRPVLQAEHDDRLVEEGPREELPPQFTGEARRVPVILQEHAPVEKRNGPERILYSRETMGNRRDHSTPCGAKSGRARSERAARRA